MIALAVTLLFVSAPPASSRLCSDCELALLAATSSIAHWRAASEDWERAAKAHETAQLRYRRMAVKRRLRIEALEASLKDLGEKTNTDVRALLPVVEDDPPDTIEREPAWMWPAIAGGVVGAGVGGYFGADAYGTKGAAIGASLGAVAIGAIVAAIPIFFDWLTSE